MTASLKALTGVILARFDALMRICSPVAGLRPMRAGRSTLTNLANPLIETGSPFDTTAVTTSVNASRTVVTVFSPTSACTATDLARSRLFMGRIVADEPGKGNHFVGGSARNHGCSRPSRVPQATGAALPGPPVGKV